VVFKKVLSTCTIINIFTNVEMYMQNEMVKGVIPPSHQSVIPRRPTRVAIFIKVQRDRGKLTEISEMY
jgi:hypothetical protein